MSKTLLQYNPATLCFEQIKPGWRKRILRLAVQISTFLAFSVLLAVIFHHFSGGIKINRLTNSNKEISKKIAHINHTLEQKHHQLAAIQHTDKNIYRTLLLQEQVSMLAWTGGTGGAALRGVSLAESYPMVNQTMEVCEKIEHKLQVQLQSLRKIAKLAEERRLYLRHKPNLQPLQVKDFVRISDLYGSRWDPITRMRCYHSGIDLAGQTGSEILAPGHGKVTFAGWDGGYGRLVEIDHGYGFKTRYGHLNGFAVRVGDTVARGTVIGYLGSSGRSTGPHLHYEVRVNNQAVNPLLYYENDLTQDEFDKIMALCQN